MMIMASLYRMLQFSIGFLASGRYTALNSSIYVKHTHKNDTLKSV